MRYIVDTNVPKVANGDATPQASLSCVRLCVARIRELQQQHVLVLDDQWHILREYMGQLRSSGQPGVGDAFLKWVLNNQRNPNHCEWVPITPIHDGRGYAEFPTDPDLANFDPSDHKFVAVALAHFQPPVPILNATDSDWSEHHEALAANGVVVDFLCPDAVSASSAS